jgi:hypothetical protein
MNGRVTKDLRERCLTLPGVSLTPPGAASATGSADTDSDPSGDPADEVTEERDVAVQNHDHETDPEQPDAAGSDAPVLQEGGPVEADASTDPDVTEVGSDRSFRAAGQSNGDTPVRRPGPSDDDATADGMPVLNTEPAADEPEVLGDPTAPSGPAIDDMAPSNGDAAGYGDAPAAYGDLDYGGASDTAGPQSAGYDDAPAGYGDVPTGYGDAPVHGGAPGYGDPALYGDPAPGYGDAPPYGDAAAAYAQGQVLADQAMPPQFYDQSQPDAGFTPLPPDGPVEPLTESAFAYMDAPGTVQEPMAAPPWPAPDAPRGPMVGPLPGVAPPSRGPLLAPSTRRRAPTKGRRVKRVVRRIELWSVLKVSLLVYLCMYLVILTAGVLLWGFAHSAGLIENFESFMNQIGFEDFRFFGDQLFKEAAIVGAVLVIAGALLTVLGVALVNLISEVTGGVRFVVIEIDADERATERPAERSSARPS